MSIETMLDEINQREAARKLVEESPQVFEGDAHAMLVATYQGRYVPSHQQLRAAFKAIEYERPKLQATAILRDESSFSAALERAIERSGKVQMIVHEAGAGNGAGKLPQIIDAKAE
jgi:hypothetical protein